MFCPEYREPGRSRDSHTWSDADSRKQGKRTVPPMGVLIQCLSRESAVILSQASEIAFQALGCHVFYFIFLVTTRES